MRKEGSSCQECGHQGNAGRGDDEFETDEHILGVLMLRMEITVMMLVVVVMITLWMIMKEMVVW